MGQKLFSIVIPIYNTPELYLRECLDSCISQGIDESIYEIICIDDGSTNEIGHVLFEYSKKHNNIIIKTQDNAGVSVARNSGINLSSGIYIWFIDPDDIINKNALTTLCKAIVNNDDVLCFNSFLFYNSFPNDIDSIVLDSKNARTMDSSVCTHLYKRCFLLENHLLFREGVWLGQDGLFNYEVNQVKHSTFVVSDILYYYRIHNKSATHTNDPIRIERFIIAHIRSATIVKQYFVSGQRDLHTIRFLHVEIEQIMVQIANLNSREAKPYLIDIIDRKLFPYRSFFSKGILINLYTNLHSFALWTVCFVSKCAAFFWLLKLWAKIRTSQIVKNLEKIIKRSIR